MSGKPTIATVTAILTRAGWPAASPGSDGFMVGVLDGGVICVQYRTGSLPIRKDAALAAMADVLSMQGWKVTDAGRVLVSEG
jgi:hypothetical protein